MTKIQGISMNRKYYILYISLFWTMLACETDPILFEGPYHVRFTDASKTVKESVREIISVEVHIVGPAPEEDVQVQYEISGDAQENVDYVILGERERVVIEEGEYFASIDIQLINNANNILRTQDLVLRIVGVNAPELGLGQGVSGIGRSYTLTIEDDCILGGRYRGQRDEASVPIEDISVTSSDCEEYLLSNWDINIFQFPQQRSLLFIDNGDNTLTIPQQEDATLPADLATIRGTGFVNPETGSIQFTIELVDFEEPAEFTFTLIPD